LNKAVDYYPGQTTLAIATCLKASGVDEVVLYINRCTRADIDALLAAGLGVHFVFETNPTYDSYFSAAQGHIDAMYAVSAANDLGLPTNTVVYLTVDENIDPRKTVPYFNAADTVFAGSRILGGVYGFQSMIDFARSQFGNFGKHLWQTYGHPNGDLDLWQNLQEPLCGIEVDVNDCYVHGLEPIVDRATYAAEIESFVKETIKVMVEQDGETRNAIAAAAGSPASASDVIAAIVKKLSA
jgi:hypothetical protein